MVVDSSLTMAVKEVLHLQPDHDCISLCMVAAGQVLVNSKTGELRLLETKNPPWKLSHTDAGRSFVHATSSAWVSDLLAHPVYWNENTGAEYVLELCNINPEERVQVPLSQWLSTRASQVCLQFGLVGTVTFNVLGSKHSKTGSLLRWSLSDVHGKISLQAMGGTSWKWLQHGWKAWVSFLGHMGLPPAHYCEPCTGAAADMGEKVEVCDSKGVSTQGLLALLVRWAWLPKSKGGLVQEEDKKKCRLFLDTFMDTIHENVPTSLLLFVDENVEWHPPTPPIRGSVLSRSALGYRQCALSGLAASLHRSSR